MSLHLWDKLRRKGLRGSLRILRERFLYRHWALLVLERDLADPLPQLRRLDEASWPPTTLTAQQLPALRRHFSAYLPTINDLLKQKGVTGFANFDREGHAACMAWVSERDYYDRHLYRCWVRLPKGCIYQFAGEVARPYRSRGLPLVMMKAMWAHYRALGFTHSRALVSCSNPPALAIHVRLGFREIGESVHVYCLFGCLYLSRSERYAERRLPDPRQRAVMGGVV